MGDIAELTIGYRVPEPILTIANRLLPLTGVDASASRSVRVEGGAPTWTHTTPGELAPTVAAVTGAVKHRHRLTGVVAPLDHHAAISAASTAPACRPSTTSTSCTTVRSRCSGRNR